MQIGLDLDEVCCDLMLHACNSIEEDYNLKLELDVFSNYDFYQCNYTGDAQHNISIADYLYELVDDEYFLMTAPPCDGIKSILDKLKVYAHDIHIITARRAEVEDCTKVWLNNNNLFISSITHTNHNLTKGLIGKNLNLDIFVDDNPPHIEDMLKHSPKTQNFLIDRPWNRDYNIKGVKRIKKLSEIL